MEKTTRINDQIRRLQLSSQVVGRKELRELPEILWDDEEVHDIIAGTYNNGNGILVATQKRLVFVDKGLLYGLKVEDFPLDKVSSIQYETGLMLGSVSIFTSGNKAVITNVDKTHARTFAEGVRARIAAAVSKAPAAAPAMLQPAGSSGGVDLTAELEKLGSLRERGLLTDDEFAAAKRKMLGV